MNALGMMLNTLAALTRAELPWKLEEMQRMRLNAEDALKAYEATPELHASGPATAVVTLTPVTKRIGFQSMMLACECGEFSATKGDYFGHSSKPFYCEGCGMEMELRRKVYFHGTTADGHFVGGSGWEIVKDGGVTLDDLED